jgi:hypothetical protein
MLDQHLRSNTSKPREGTTVRMLRQVAACGKDSLRTQNPQWRSEVDVELREV